MIGLNIYVKETNLSTKYNPFLFVECFFLLVYQKKYLSNLLLFLELFHLDFQHLLGEYIVSGELQSKKKNVKKL